MHKKLTLEFLATFKLAPGIVSFHRVGSIQFQLFGTLQRMSFIGLALKLGLYDEELTQIPSYNALLIVGPPANKNYDLRSSKLLSSNLPPLGTYTPS